eukprot:9503443-Lingulodinium_polyedra.AAC.1
MRTHTQFRPSEAGLRATQFTTCSENDHFGKASVQRSSFWNTQSPRFCKCGLFWHLACNICAESAP